MDTTKYYEKLKADCETLSEEIFGSIQACFSIVASQYQRNIIGNIEQTARTIAGEIGKAFQSINTPEAKIQNTGYVQKQLRELEFIAQILKGIETFGFGDTANNVFIRGSAAFEAAQKSHKRWAIFFSCSMLIPLLIVGLLIGASLGNPPDVSTVERLIFHLTGKISIVFFAIWTMRYIMILYKAHAEQAITYNDRQMALSIAESMFKLSTASDERSKILSSLNTGYFDFTKNSFTSVKDTSILPTKKQISALSETVKPILDVIKSSSPVNEATKKEKVKED